MITPQIAIDVNGWPIVLDIVLTPIRDGVVRLDLVRTPMKKGPKRPDVVASCETVEAEPYLQANIDRLAVEAAEKIHKTHTK